MKSSNKSVCMEVLLGGNFFKEMSDSELPATLKIVLRTFLRFKIKA